MRAQKRIAVVVPAWNEERLIGRVLGRIPSFVDVVVVVDDASTDSTSECAAQAGDARVVVLRHSRNHGVGAAIVSGVRYAFGAGADIAAVMAGDDQMDPSDLASVIEPIVSGRDRKSGV